MNMGPGGRGGHGGRNMGIAKMPKGGMKLIRRLIRYVAVNYKWSLLAVLVCILITSVTTLTSTLFTRTLIDDYILPLTQMEHPDFTPLAHALMKLAAVLMVGALCSYIHSRLMINVSQGTLKRLRIDVFSHMQQLPIKYFDTHAHGNTMSVYTNDIDTLRQMISSMPNLFSSLVTIILTLTSMIVLSLPLTILTLLMSMVMIYTTRKLGSRSSKFFYAQQTNLGNMNGFVEEMLTGQKVVKIFCHEDEAVDQFQQLNENLRSSTYNANRVANIVMPVNGNLSNLIYVMTAIFGAMLALRYTVNATPLATPMTPLVGEVLPIASALTVGTLVSFLTLIKNFTRPISEVSNQINSIINAVAGAMRVFDVLDAEPEKEEQADVTLVNVREQSDGTLTETKDSTGIWAWKTTDGLVRQRGEVDFFGVDFSYPIIQEDGKEGLGRQVLFDIEMDTDAGQKIALVGGTGAGKTTITNLINRFYDIQDGRILYDGINISSIRRQELRRSLGMVLQETHLFTGTVMENIRYGRLEATDEECIAAAKLVHADDFISRLSEGYQTMLTGDGGNLSQGERQLIAIARAAVANPPALILDEATSSIDTRTEQLVQQGMDSLMQGRTTFVIAHRLSTIRNADWIMVMDHGRIIERGNHTQLLAMKGKYYQLYTGNQITA
jgi:ATP-binding cassette subfamily B protein